MSKNHLTPLRFAKTFLFAAAATFSASLAPVPAEAATYSSFSMTDDADGAAGKTITISDGGSFYIDSGLTATFSGNLILSGSATFYMRLGTALTFDDKSSVTGTTLTRYNSSSYTGMLAFEGDVDLTYLYNYYGTTNFTGADVEIDYLYNYYGTTNFDGADATIGTIVLGTSSSYTGTVNVYGGTNLTLSGLYNSYKSTFNIGNATVTFDTTFSSVRAIVLSNSLDDVYTGTTFCVADGETVALSGVISGAGSLTKTGAGTLTLSATNTFTGGLTVSEGKLSASSTTCLGSGGVYVDADGTLSLAATSGISASYISGTGVVSVTLSDSAYNTLVVGDGESFTGTVYVSSGSFEISDETTYCSTVELADGVGVYVGLGDRVTFSGTLIADGTAYIQTDCASTDFGLTFDENSSVFGDTISRESGHYYSGLVTFEGSVCLTEFTICYGTTTNFDGAYVQVDSLTFSGDGTINVFGGTTLSLAGVSGSSGTLALGNATITSSEECSFSHAIKLSTLLDDEYTGTTFDVSSLASVTLSGTVSGAGSLEKTGKGLLVLSGSNTYSGGTTIAQGTLRVASMNNLGSGDVYVGSAGMLSVTTSSAGFSESDISGTGTVRIALTSDSSNVLAVGDGSSFTGTTYVASGYFTYDDDTVFGSALVIADNARIYIPSGTDAIFSENLVVYNDSGTCVCVYSDSVLTFDENSSVSGETFTRYNNSSYTGAVYFCGGVDVTSFFAYRGMNHFVGADVDIGHFYNYYGATYFNGTKGAIGTLALGLSSSYTGNVYIYGGTELTLGGISGTAGTLSLGNAKIAAEKSWSASRTIVLSNTLDSNYTGTVFQIADGKTVELSGAISGAGSLTKTGTGTLVLSGSFSANGGISVSAGTLDLSGAAISLSSAIENAGTVAVSADTVFTLTSALLLGDSDTATYVLVAGTGTIEGWDTLTAANFALDETVQRHTAVDVGTAGAVSVTFYSANVIWTGAKSAVWDAGTSANWLCDGASDVFYKNDSVLLGADAAETSVTVSGAIVAETLIVEAADYTLGISDDSSLDAEAIYVEEDASLAVDGALTVGGGTVAGTLSVTALTVADDATLTLSGTGTLEIAETLAATGTVYVGGNATLAFNEALSGISQANIAGTGTVSVALTSSSSNTLQIGDGASFTGTTVVTSGAFSYDGETEFGSTLELATGTRVYVSADTSATFSGKLILDGTTYFYLYSGASLTFDENSAVSGDTFQNYWYGTLTFRGNVDVETFCADTFSSGTTNFDGANAEIGMLEFSTSATVNIYGDTELTLGGISGTAGTLSLGNATIIAETSWESSREIVLSTSLDDDYTGTIFEIADGETVELSGTLSGAGSLEKTGAGTLTLSAANTFTGGTAVSAGTLVAAISGALGSGEISVAENATLELDFGGTETYSNTFGGAGTVRVASGTTAGFSSDFGAKTLSVASGATLSGGVSFSNESATLDLAGTLELSWSETISAAGALSVVLSETSALDLSYYSVWRMRYYGETLTVFDGNDIAFTVASADEESGENSSGVAARSTSDEDSSVSDAIENFLLSDVEIASLAESTVLVYSTSDGLSVRVASNYESVSIGAVHDGLSELAAVIFGNLEEAAELAAGLYSEEELGEIIGVDFSDPIVAAAIAGTGDAGTLLETASPLSYAALVAVPVAAFQNDVRNVLSRLDMRRFSVYEGREWQIYAQAQYLSAENDDASDTPTFDYNLLGILAGADRRLSPTTLVGIALAAGTGEAEVHHGGGEIEITDYRLTGYVSKLFAQRIAFDFGAHAGLGDYEIKRKTAYGNVRGDTDSLNFGVFGNVGTWLRLSQNYEIFAEPFIGVTAMYSSVSGFAEGGNGGKFDVDDFDALSVAASVGCNFAWEFALLGTKSRVGVGIAYTHEFCDDEVDIDARFIGGNTKYGVSAAALASDRFSVGPTLEIGLTQSLGVYAGYTFEIGTDSSASHSANIGVRASF